MKLLIKICLAILILPTSINAEEFSYDYIDIGIERDDLEASTRGSLYEGYFVYVSKTLSKNIHLLGSYIDSEKSDGNTLDSKYIGFGVNYPINKSTDIVVDYLHYKYKGTYKYLTSTYSSGGRVNSIEPEIRHQFTDDIELNTGLIWQNFAGRPVTYKGLSAGAIYRINNDLSLNYKIGRAKDSASNTLDWEHREFGIRYHF